MRYITCSSEHGKCLHIHYLSGHVGGPALASVLNSRATYLHEADLDWLAALSTYAHLRRTIAYYRPRALHLVMWDGERFVPVDHSDKRGDPRDDVLADSLGGILRPKTLLIPTDAIENDVRRPTAEWQAIFAHVATNPERTPEYQDQWNGRPDPELEERRSS